MEDNDLLFQYFEKFGEFPPILMMTNYEDNNYQRAMDWAIDNGTKLDLDNISQFFENNYDVVSENPKKQDQEPKGEPKMEDKDLTKIQNLLKTYGAEDNEIKNFMQDLTAEAKETDTPKEEEEEDAPYILNKDNIDKLKLTEEGKDLIMKAPEMAKDELEEAIKNYLEKYKD